MTTRAPTLEMLWEPKDPETALAQRFGFGTTEEAAAWVAATLDRHWGIEAAACERIVLSFKNALVWLQTPGGPLLAKWSIAASRFERLAGLAELTAWLARHDLPVSAPIPATNGQLQVEVDGVSRASPRTRRHGGTLWCCGSRWR